MKIKGISLCIGLRHTDAFLFFSANKENLMLDFFLDKSPDTIKVTQQKSGSSVGGGQIASVFEKIEANLSPELVSKTNAIFHFVVKGW
jgi:hypothetical protein